MERKLKLNKEFVELKMKDLNMSLAELAGLTGVVYTTLMKYLSSDEVKISFINKLAEVLDTDVSNLIKVI